MRRRAGTMASGLATAAFLLTSACSSTDGLPAGGTAPPSVQSSTAPAVAASTTATSGPIPSATAPSPSAETAPDTPLSPSSPPAPIGEGLPAELRGADLELLPGNERVVALTFDAGANDAAVASILATLAAKDVPATFFLTGAWVHAYPEQAREIAALHPVANHSVSHRDMTTLTDAEARAEVVDAEAAIEAVTGQSPRPWWRFPLGARDPRTIDLVNDLGYVSFRWTVDSLGWQGTSGGMSAEKVHERVLGGLEPGEIVLFHVGSNPDDGSILDADALPGVIDAIRAEGYGFVTLDSVIPHA